MFYVRFHPRDVMIAQLIAMALCLSVCLPVHACSCLSQVSVLWKRIDPIFRLEASFDRSHIVISGKIQVPTKIRVLSSGPFS